MSKRVVICIPCFLVGGTEVHTGFLARALVQEGYSVTVCVYYEYDPVMVSDVERVGAKVRLLQFNRDSGGRNIGRMPRLAACLAKVFLQEQPDFVHVQYMTPGVIPIVVARLCYVPSVIATVHVPGRHYGRKIWLPRTAARLCDAFLCVSRAAEESIFGSSVLFDADLLRSGRHHFTIHNCADLEKVDEVISSGLVERKRKELALNKHPVVGVLGRLSPEKGQQRLIDALPKVIRRVPSAKLVVVGDGPDRPELIVSAKRLGVSRNVLWIGNKVPQEEAFFYVGLMDVVVVPSKWEGFGLTAVEAMAFGKPVVASDIDGLREVVLDQKTGILVPPNDARIMANAICSLLLDPALSHRLGNAGRSRVEQLFSIKRFADQYLHLYSTLSSLC